MKILVFIVLCFSTVVFGSEIINLNTILQALRAIINNQKYEGALRFLVDTPWPSPELVGENVQKEFFLTAADHVFYYSRTINGLNELSLRKHGMEIENTASSGKDKFTRLESLFLLKAWTWSRDQRNHLSLMQLKEWGRDDEQVAHAMSHYLMMLSDIDRNGHSIGAVCASNNHLVCKHLFMHPDLFRLAPEVIVWIVDILWIRVFSSYDASVPTLAPSEDIMRKMVSYEYIARRRFGCNFKLGLSQIASALPIGHPLREFDEYLKRLPW